MTIADDAGADATPARKMTILVVDDEAPLLLTLVANLELSGFEVLDAPGARQALEIARSRHLDLILSDIRMPGMSGVDLLRALRESGCDVPVVLMTAFTVESVLTEALREGVFTIVAKPFDVDGLVVSLTTAASRPIVLVVDDEPPVAQAAAAALAAMGIRTASAGGGAEAIERVRRGDVDVVVVDMVMPGLTGAEVVEQIARLDRGIACIGVSGHDAPALFRRAAENVVSFLRKPYRPTDLASSIARARSRPAERS